MALAPLSEEEACGALFTAGAGRAVLRWPEGFGFGWRVCVGARVSCSVVRTLPTVVLGDCFPNLLLRARGCPQGASVADWWRGVVSPFSCTMPAAGHLAVWK